MQSLTRIENLIRIVDKELGGTMAQAAESKLDDFKIEFRTCDNYINGKFVAPKDGKYMDVHSPRNGKVIGKVALSTKEDVALAVKHGLEAFEKWSNLTVKQRVQPLFKLKQLIEQNEEMFAKIIMLEHGKNRVEAIGSIRKGNETVEYACSMPQLIGGKILEVSSGVFCKEFRLPHGVVASIVPFNFPIMVPLWTLPIAIACGNVYILKPSEKVPLTMNYFANLMEQAGFPHGVFQIINGAASAVTALTDNINIKALSFVGSSKIARLVYDRCKAQIPIPKRCLCLGGAKNHLVAVNDCNIEMTANDVVNSFCGCSGQRCMAASVLLLVGEQPELIKKVCEFAEQLEPDDLEVETSKKSTRNLGPVIDDTSLKRMYKYIEEAEKNGAKILLDGRNWSEKMKKQGGFWLGPTVILYNNCEAPGMLDEIFGPILSIYVCKDKEEAIRIENKSEYGNAACIYTSTGANSEWFIKRFKSGMLGVNIGVPVPREPFSFGGINGSKFGDFDITGDGGIEFWTWRKKITQKWTPPREKSWLN